MTHTIYIADYIPATNDQWRLGRRIELYRGPSLASASRACADELGYRSLRSALSWDVENVSYYARRRGYHERAAVARVYIEETIRPRTSWTSEE